MATDSQTSEQTSEYIETERRLVAEVFNEGNIAAIDEIHTPDYVGHWYLPQGGEAGIDDLKEFVASIHEGFDDFRMDEEFVLAEGNMVTLGYRTSGVHAGEFMGIPATDERGESVGIMVHRYEDGKIAEGWAVWNQLGMLQQLGVVPREFHLADFLETAVTLTKQDVLKRARGED
jgi:steroid delta-isomerase-like uncharacterized protein